MVFPKIDRSWKILLCLLDIILFFIAFSFLNKCHHIIIIYHNRFVKELNIFQLFAFLQTEKSEGEIEILEGL